MATKLKSKLAAWLGIGGVVVGVFLFTQAFWTYYMTRFGDVWKVFLQLI